MMPPKTIALLDTLINEMAAALIESAADLHDERQVLRALVAAGYSEGDVLGLHDQVVAVAQAKTTNPGETHVQARYPIR